ncbi:DNA-binding MarR family transcriptional regulator [Elusimicrobium simillimum]|uniref:MarR family winged helix-turn-helix transcriptional regulator n=1 Tax=Elusimicrobium simillimum TaxID=3143438 RepID=UPI003C6FA88A
MTEREISLMEKFVRAGALMHRMHHHMHHMAGGPFANAHRGQGRVLALLKIQPNISQKDLAYLLDLRAQSLSELLAKLEKNGLVQRSASETDRRSMNISLTPAGEEAALQGEETSKEDFFSFLSDEEKTNLSNMLDKIIEGFGDRISEGEEHGGHRHHFSHFHRHCGGFEREDHGGGHGEGCERGQHHEGMTGHFRRGPGRRR